MSVFCMRLDFPASRHLLNYYGAVLLPL